MNISGIAKDTVDRVVQLAARVVDSVEEATGYLGTVAKRNSSYHTDQLALMKTLKHLGDQLVASIDDFRSAMDQGLADAVGGLKTSLDNANSELTAALDRVNTKLGTLVAAQAGQITPDDVAALQADIGKVTDAAKGIDTLTSGLKGVAEDPATPVPADAPPLDTPAPAPDQPQRGGRRGA